MMAEANSSNTQECGETKDFEMDCAICLQPCVHPAELPCGHIFCFLCVKGIALQSRKCALCRQIIPSDYIDHPTLVKWNTVLDKLKSLDDQYQWFYEGRNGWWQYDQRTSLELETAYKDDKDKCEVLIAGFVYVVDFKLMMQYRKNEVFRRRRIKRDSPTIPKKGIAGLKTDTNESEPNHSEDNEPNTYGRIENRTPVTPSNTPQSPNSARQSPEDDSFLERFRTLQIQPNTLRDRNNNSDNHNANTSRRRSS